MADLACGEALMEVITSNRIPQAGIFYFSDWVMPRAAALSQTWLFAREQLSKTIIAGHACSDARKTIIAASP
jgi:hypothetical protein